jgi:hypothetical protein
VTRGMLLRGGLVADGIGSTARRGDVLIDGAEIASVDARGAAPAGCDRTTKINSARRRTTKINSGDRCLLLTLRWVESRHRSCRRGVMRNCRVAQ